MLTFRQPLLPSSERFLLAAIGVAEFTQTISITVSTGGFIQKHPSIFAASSRFVLDSSALVYHHQWEMVAHCSLATSA